MGPSGKDTPVVKDKKITIICVDESGSMGEKASNNKEASDYTRRDFAVQGAMLCVGAMPVGTYLSVTAFDDRPRVVCEPIVVTQENRESICDKIKQIVPKGGTNIKSSIVLAKLVMERAGCDNAHIILITDGEDDALRNGTDLETKFKDLRTHGEFAFKIDTIGLGPNADTKLLVKIAGLCRGVYALCISAFEVGTVFGRAAVRSFTHNNDIFCISDVNEPNTRVYTETKQKYIYFKDKLAEILIDDDYSKEYVELEQTNNLKNYTEEISGWIHDHKSTHQVSDYFQRIRNIQSDVKEQIYLAISTNTYWKDWGYSYWKTTGIALKKCYSPNSKDACLAHFGSDKAKQLYEEVSTLYESMPLIEATGYSGYSGYGGGGGGIPQAQAVVLTTAHFNDRDAGCFHPHSELETLDQLIIDDAYIVERMKENKEVWLKGGEDEYVKVEAIIRTSRKNAVTEFCNFKGTILTPTHPIMNNNVWNHPKYISPIYAEKVDYVFNLVLAINPRTGKRYTSVYVDENLCVCLGHGIADGSVAEDSFWGTERVVDEYKRLYPDDYAKGYIENTVHTMVRDVKTGYVIGFKIND